VFLGQAHDDRLGKLEKAAALAPVDRGESGSAIDRLKRVVDFELERSGGRLGGEPLIGYEVRDLRGRLETASQEPSDEQDRGAHADRPLARLSRLGHPGRPVGGLAGVDKKGEDLIHRPIDHGHNLKLVHGSSSS